MTLLAMRDVACRRGDRWLFSGLTLSLSAGEALLVRGRNGIGKSSLIRLAAGLLRPAAGTIDRHGAVALADELLALDLDRSLARALSLWARIDGADNHAVAQAMERLSITHLSDVPVRMLSTGQRKRAALARVAASGAPIWLLDEPGNGLDVDGVAQLGQLVADHLARGGAILAASHTPLPVAAGEIDLAPLTQTETHTPDDEDGW